MGLCITEISIAIFVFIKSEILYRFGLMMSDRKVVLMQTHIFLCLHVMPIFFLMSRLCLTLACTCYFAILERTFEGGDATPQHICHLIAIEPCNEDEPKVGAALNPNIPNMTTLGHIFTIPGVRECCLFAAVPGDVVLLGGKVGGLNCCLLSSSWVM